MSEYMTSLSDVQIVKVRGDISKLLTLMKAEKICEIGVRNGDHLKDLLVPCVNIAIAVDIWKETGVRSQNDNCYIKEELDSQYGNIINMSIANPAIKIVRDFSVNASKYFPDNYFDFVYIDADHTEEAVYADLCAWWAKVRSGVVLSGHDYAHAIPTTKDNVLLKFGVIESVNRFVAEHQLELHVDYNQSWFIPKK